tara:strand:- start:110405 stop:111931 length:1527 start_codon:yes stop_codon:yes gene_type:complete
MDTQKKTGIIYCRVSSAEQVKGTSLRSQERICKEYADHKGIQVLKCFVEEGESAKTANRPKFQEAISYCSKKKNSIDFFLVYKIDRFARNQNDHVVARSFLKKYGTSLQSVTEHMDDSPVGMLSEGMLALFAEFENSTRATRSKGGMVERVKSGVWVWKAPLGYKRVIKGGNLVIDDSVAPYIRMAFEEWSKGVHSFKSLSNLLYKKGLVGSSGKKLYPQSIEKIIKNHIYYGLIQAFDMEVVGSFEPIISEDLFWKCQPGVHRKYGDGPRLKQNPEFPLRKFVKCDHCEVTLTGSSSTGRKGKKYPYYHHQKQNCPHAKSHSKEKFEANFISFLETVAPKEKEYEEAFKAVVLDVWQSNFKKLDKENEKVRRDISNLEDERQKVFEFHRSGVYKDIEFLEQKESINKRIHLNKSLLKEKQFEELNMDEALSFCFDFVRDSSKTWKDLEKQPEHRLRFQKLLFPEKITFDGAKFGTTKMSLIFEINKKAGADTSKLVTLRGIEPRFPP